MKHFKRATYLILAIFSFISVKAYSMNTKPPVEKVHYEPSPSTPRCVGRYLIDVPENFEDTNQKKEGNVGKISGIGVFAQYPMTYQDFENKVEMREKLLMSGTNPLLTADKEIDRPFLKDIEPVMIDGHRAIILNRNESSSGPDSSRMLEAYMWSNNVSIKLTVSARDLSGDRYKKWREEYNIPSTIAQKHQDLITVMKSIEGWDDVNLPPTPGSCFPYIYIKGKPALSENSVGGWFYKLKEYDQKIGIILDFNTYIKAQSSLLERFNKDANNSDQKILRKGIVHLPGIPKAHAEELLTVTKSGEHLFTLLVNERIGSKNTPYIGIDFYDKGLLKQEDAIAIWDGLLKTLRPRPGAF